MTDLGFTPITLAYPYTDPDGESHDPDSTIEVPDQVAHDLIAAGRARTPDVDPADDPPRKKRSTRTVDTSAAEGNPS